MNYILQLANVITPKSHINTWSIHLTKCQLKHTNKGSIKVSTIWKWPHRHPRSLQVFDTCISLTLCFLQTSCRIFLWIFHVLLFESCILTLIFSTDEGSSTSRNILNNTSKNSQCQTINLQHQREWEWMLDVNNFLWVCLCASVP